MTNKFPYTRVRHGNRVFTPTKDLKAMGFQFRNLGPEGELAQLEALRIEQAIKKARTHGTTAAPLRYPVGSMGHGWERMLGTQAWQAKSHATRNRDWWYVWGNFIEPVFGDVAPSTIQPEHVEDLYTDILKSKGLHTAHRFIKIWRAFWRVLSTFKYCEASRNPAQLIRNTAPKGRSQTWAMGEVAQIAKQAWRDGDRGLAALLSVMWDTQFEPVDCRRLKLSQLRRDGSGSYFETARGKSGADVVGTLSRRSKRVLESYLGSLGFDLTREAPIFRDQHGQPFTADSLGDSFRLAREKTFTGDKRQMRDIRRTGAVEAIAGDASPSALAAKMGNTIDHNRFLQDTYLPKKTATVRLADEARKRGRRLLRENGS